MHNEHFARFILLLLLLLLFIMHSLDAIESTKTVFSLSLIHTEIIINGITLSSRFSFRRFINNLQCLRSRAALFSHANDHF